jgi:hypothetical protein
MFSNHESAAGCTNEVVLEAAQPLLARLPAFNCPTSSVTWWNGEHRLRDSIEERMRPPFVLRIAQSMAFQGLTLVTLSYPAR